jgi:hypothetical protein
MTKLQKAEAALEQAQTHYAAYRRAARVGLRPRTLE